MSEEHDIVPTLRMFDGLYMNLAADEIERLRNQLAAVRDEVKNVRRFHFQHNPANTGLAIGFNSILAKIDDLPRGRVIND
jgi:hypothetical protein